MSRSSNWSTSLLSLPAQGLAGAHVVPSCNGNLLLVARMSRLLLDPFIQ